MRSFNIRKEAHFGDRVIDCIHPRPHNTYHWFSEIAAAAPDADAIVFRDRTTSFSELESEIARVASGFKEAGIQPGERIVIFSGNRPETIICCYAAMRIGAVFVPVDIRLHGAEVAYIAHNCGASALIYDAGLRDRISDTHALPDGCRFIEIPSTDTGNRMFPEISSGSHDAWSGGTEEELVMIIYTSGTTGRPKGAMLSHLNIVHSCLHFHWNEDITSADRIGVVTPITHVTGLVMGVFGALQAGAAVLLLEAFKVRPFLEMASRHRMTQTVMVPAMYSLCLLDETIDQYDLSSWRLGNYGGAIMPEATIVALTTRFPHLALVNGYGSSETCSPSAMLRPGEGFDHRESVGRALPCADIVIVDDSGTQLPPGQAGEIWISGPMVAKGYWNNPDATAGSFTGGYWHSGDVGSIDEDGYLRILDRLKDVVNRGGYKIYSAEVENTLAAMDHVREVAIVGRPDPVLGERVHAFVTMAGTATAEDLRAYCAERLADYKVPESFTISTEPLPRSANGKILKRELREAVRGMPPPTRGGRTEDTARKKERMNE